MSGSTRRPIVHDDFASLYSYNRWADLLVLDACRKLTAAQYAAEPAPGWSSVRATMVHIAIVTRGWLGALADEALTGDIPTEADFPTIDDAARLLDEAQQTLDGLLPRLTPEWLAAPKLISRGSRSATLPPWVVLRHVVNHATYHRGQIASKLKRFGIEQPATDFVFWAFEQIPQG
jgi:uncharacterized damage-inducible protein DinB